MEKIEKTIRYTKLFNLYGSLLSDAQKEILSDYFFADLSISEISENRDISRAAVEDALSKGTKKLDYYEENLKSLAKQEKLRAKLEELERICDDKEEIDMVKKILEELDNGIWKSNWKTIKNI